MSLDPHGPQDLKGTTEAVVHRHDGCLASGVAMCFPSPVNSYLTYIEWGKTSHPSDTLYSIGKMKKNLNSRPGKAQAFAIYIYIILYYIYNIYTCLCFIDHSWSMIFNMCHNFPWIITKSILYNWFSNKKWLILRENAGTMWCHPTYGCGLIEL